MEALRPAVDSLILQHRGAVVLVHGGNASGADMMGDVLWRQWRKFQPNWLAEPEIHPADWARHGRKAGPIRNQEMVDLGADVCVAFIRDRSRGATGTVKLAETAGIPVRVIQQDSP